MGVGMRPQAVALRDTRTIQLLAAVVLLALAAAFLIWSDDEPARVRGASVAPTKVPAPKDNTVVLAKSESRQGAVDLLMSTVDASKAASKRSTPAEAPAATKEERTYTSFEWMISVPVTHPTTGEAAPVWFGLIFYEGPEDDTTVDPVAEPVVRALCDVPIPFTECRPVDAYNPSPGSEVP
jgi:hypothetical protein